MTIVNGDDYELQAQESFQLVGPGQQGDVDFALLRPGVDGDRIAEPKQQGDVDLSLLGPGFDGDNVC